jgi:tripartite ATP-independent transporter DctM subunit
MLVVVFLLALIVVGVVLAASGATDRASLPLHQLLAITVVFAVFFVSGIYVAAALGMLSLAADLAFSTRGMNEFFGQIAWNTSSDFIFAAVPMFLLMGEILLRSGLSERLYRALNLWVGRLPGGLLHTNVVASGVFSAVSGSSIACAAMIGSVALPYFRGTRYPRRMVLGSLAAGGAMGNLIPPGISLIIYGLFTDTSIGKLYASAMVAGVLVALMFMAFIAIHSLATHAQYGTLAPVSLEERLRSLVDLVPTLLLIFVVLGLLYLGLATATEAAALGVVGSVVIAAMYRRLSLRTLRESLRATARTTSMVGLILIAALILNFVLSGLHLPSALASSISALPLPAPVLMAFILLFYLALGTFMDGFAMMVTTLPVIFPVVTGLGYDAVWFGVIVTIIIEMALISPPDGMVMYVLQGLREPGAPISDVFYGVLPFLGIYALALLLFFLAPAIILWPV